MLISAVILVFLGTAILLALFFIKNDHGDKEPLSALWTAGLIGLSGFIGAGYIESLLIPVNSLSPKTSTLSMSFFTYILVGVIEESLKFIPLALYIYKKKYFNEHTDGIIYFALAGIGFGVPENIVYVVSYGASAGIGRLILDPFFHAATVAIVGYYLIKVKLDHKSWLSVILAFVGVVMIHCIYDFCLSTSNGTMIMLSVLITFIASIMLFILFFKANKLDKKSGLTIRNKNKRS
ncbi:MAG: PrsW family glutamic-type intramembrane protease [bacterium]|jgi:RsiW-degrading membrane proteinase PrsW (M82 family)